VLRTRKYVYRVIVVDDGCLDHPAEMAAGTNEPRSSTIKARNVQVPSKKRLERFPSIFSSSFFINITKSIIFGAWIP
jgi:hypothetical protein